MAVACSADGIRLFAAEGNGWRDGPILTSIDAGKTWNVTSAPSNNWNSVASSADGTRLVAAGEDGPIYTSTNGGLTWGAGSSLTEGWYAVACSADGSRFAAANGLTDGGDSAAKGFIYTAPYSGPAFAASGPVIDWTSIASSSEGTRLVAAGADGPTWAIYTSSDPPTTWVRTSAPITNWASVASSADGTKLVAAADPGPIYASTNSGSTWAKTTAPLTNWSSIAVSADANTIVALALGYGLFTGEEPGPIYVSTDSGATWTQAKAPVEFWSSVACSADGRICVAVADDAPDYDAVDPCYTNGGVVYTSTDSGATWTPQAGAPSAFWSSVASSRDGSKMAAAPLFGPIYLSTNSGRDWFATSSPSLGWSAIVSSADGKNLVARSSGPLYASSDSGASWFQANVPAGNWSAIALSSDGGRLVAVGNPGPIYRLPFPTPLLPMLSMPKLLLSTSGGGLRLEWLVPSAPFLLQENSDLSTSDWTDVPGTPTLNFTNLHDEAIIQPHQNRAFFRLKQR
jgi:hypothetical protein